MAQYFPETGDSPYAADAADGDASHEIGKTLIESYMVGNFNLTAADFTGKLASNGVVFNDEMFDGAKIYADDVLKVMREHAIFSGENIGVEKQIHCPRIHDESFGTIDSFIFARNAYRLYIWDYKFGHDKVEVFENWQLMNYLAGLVDLLNINGIDDQNIKVHMRIVQPRAHHRDGVVREWATTLSNVRGYFNVLSSSAHEALNADAKVRTGPHCRHCEARVGCESGLQAGLRLYEITGLPVPVELSPLALGVQLLIINRALNQLKYLETAYNEQILRLMKSGVDVPNWIIEQGFGRETWKRPIPEIIALGEIMGVNLKKPDDVITPNQARTTTTIDNDIVTAYAHKPKTGLKIVPLTNSKLKQVFES